MSVQTYSLTAEDVAARWPQTLELDDVNGPATTARVDDLITSACSVVNGILTSAGIDVGEVNSDVQARTATVEYVYDVLLPSVLRLMREDADTIRDAEDVMRSALGRLRAAPRIIGITSSAAISPGASTSTSSLGLDTSEAAMLQRRRYAGGRSSSPRHNRFHW